MNDLDQKIRLQILVNNYAAIADNEDPELDITNARRVIAEVGKDVPTWIRQSSKKPEHQLAFTTALERLADFEGSFKGDKAFHNLAKLLEEAMITEENISHAVIAIAFNLLEKVNFLAGSQMGDIEYVLKFYFPRFRLSPVSSIKNHTIKRLRQDIPDFRSPYSRTTLRRLFTERRVKDYYKVLSLFSDIQKRETERNSLVQLAIEEATKELEVAVISLEKFKKGNLIDEDEGIRSEPK
jgi:hypothetical protein